MQSRYVRDRGGMALIVEVLTRNLSDLSPAEWLGLADRLAVIDAMTVVDASRRD